MSTSEQEIKIKDRILEAIDQLRKRKARPDVVRICNYMMRKFSVPPERTRGYLQMCMSKELVYMVEYKGDTSYRNALKWHPRNRSGDIIDQSIYSDKKVSGSFAKIVSLAISELICQEPDFLELGVPAPALCKTILAKSLVKYNKKHLGVLLAQEVEKGGLVKLENGYYSLGSNVVDTDKSDEEVEDMPQSQFSFASDTKEESTENKRVGGRKKLAKKVFDPSDNNLPKRKRGRPMGTNKEKSYGKKSHTYASYSKWGSMPPSATVTSSSVCTICQQGKKHYERLVPCQGCNNKAHLSCLPSSSPQQIWHCYQCKGCVVCFQTIQHRPAEVCSICANAFHNECHVPKIELNRDSSEPWICHNCRSSDCLMRRVKTEPFDSKAEGTSSARSESSLSTPPPTLSPQNRHSNDNSYSSDSKHSNVSVDEQESNKNYDQMEDVDPTIPDATSWTSNDVYHYFSQYFPQEAAIFRDQEIDGHSLLLMKRKDVLTNLQLNLGPALKIYRHVLRLQVRKDNVKLGWF